MKGIVFNEFESFAKARLGARRWFEVLREVSGSAETVYLGPGNYADSKFVELVEHTAAAADTDAHGLQREFGAFFFPRFAERFPTLLNGHRSAKSFLLRFGDIARDEVRKLSPDASTFDFEYVDPGPRRLQMTDRFGRRLCAFIEGLLEGVGTWFWERIHCTHALCRERGDDACRFDLVFRRVHAPLPKPGPASDLPDPEASMDEDLIKLELKRSRLALRRTENLLESKSRALYVEAGLLRRAYERLSETHEQMKQTQAQLIQSAKMASIGQLAAGIAHEINNPVGFMLSNINTLMEYAADLERLVAAARAAAGGDGAFQELEARLGPDAVLADVRHALSDCRDGGERIRDIVRGLRDFSHADDAEMVPYDINRELDNTIRICLNEIKHKAAIHRDYGRVPALRGNPRQLTQVFMNLLVNAAQAIDGNGEIVVRTRVEEGEVVVRVRDTGPGIPPDVRAHLFEPFVTTKPVGKGTGLGLHVAYKITQGHGGRIDAVSPPGGGTEFIVRLPLTAEPALRTAV